MFVIVLDPETAPTVIDRLFADVDEIVAYEERYLARRQYSVFRLEPVDRPQ